MDREYCPYCMNPVEPGAACPACGLTAGAYAPSPHHLPPGTVLRDRYLVGRVLGEGGFGITYIGCDLRLELKVAIKEYFPTDRANRVAAADLSVSSYSGAAGERYQSGKARFLQEARTMARMDKQPVIVSVRDFFELNNTAYIVMEYVEGTTFKDLVPQRGGRIPAGELLHEMEPLFSALAAMHRQGLIHRDISPENLMLENGDVRLLDFGCARESAGGEATLTIALKHGYAPVEQYQNKGQGPWTDVYALSATMYYCLTGRKPPQSMDRLVDDELVPPRKLGVELTERQEKALLYGMGVRPRKRFQSVEELHAALYEGVLPDGLELPEVKPQPEPAPQPEPVPPEPQPVPDSQMETKLHTPVSTVSQDGPEPTEPGPEPQAESNALAWLKAHWQIAAGAGAALVLLIVLLAWHPWTGAPDPDPGSSQPTAQASGSPAQTSGSPAQASEPVPASFSPEQTDEENGLVLLAMLADDSVEEITIPADMCAVVHEHVTLTKSLRVEKNQYGTLYFPNGLTVAQGGRLQIWGSINAASLLRTMDGGTVSVEAGGQLYSSLIWLEREEDLVCAPDASVNVWGGWNPTQEPLDNLYRYSHYMILDEEALFEGAVQVSSGEEFAAACQGPAPIIINGEVTLPDYCCATVPVLIPEGYALNAPFDENGDCTLDVDCTVLVNRGTLRGRVSLMDMSADQARANPRLLNFGAVEAELNSFAGYAAGTIVNQGRITFSGAPSLNQAYFINLNRVVLPQGVSATMAGNEFTNAGEVAVSGGTWIAQNNVSNFSSFLLYEKGALINRGNFNSEFGALDVCPGSTVENHLKMEIGRAKFTLQASVGGIGSVTKFRNEGVLLYGADSLDFSQTAVLSGEGRMIPFSWYDAHGDERTRMVSTERELRQALINPAVDLIIWNGNITLTEGDLEITKGVVLNAPDAEHGGNSTFHGGTLTVTGENAFLIFNNLVFSGGNGLRVENGGTVLFHGGDDPNLGSLSVDSGGLFASTSYATIEGPVSVSGGGRILDTGSIRVRGGPMTIEEGSALESWADLEVELAAAVNDGLLRAEGFSLTGGALTNNGRAYFGRHLYTTGTVDNYGEMDIASGGEFVGRVVNRPEGVITLEGANPQECPVVRGTMDNQGVIRAPNGGDLSTNGGTITGNLIQYE